MKTVSRILLSTIVGWWLTKTALSTGDGHILDVVEREGLTQLLEAIDADSFLKSILESEGKRTLLAPTNEAFLRGFPGISYDDLLLNTELLTMVLEYHVVDAEITMEVVATSSFYGGMTVPTLRGEAMDFQVISEFGCPPQVCPPDFTVNQLPITTADVQGASNGVIHIVDQVLIPPSLLIADPGTIMDRAMGLNDLRIFIDAVGRADLGLLLNLPGPFTVLAPTDDAFRDLGDLELSNLLDAPNKLSRILQNHIIPSRLSASDLFSATNDCFDSVLDDENEAPLCIGQDGLFTLTVNDATMRGRSVSASNGILYKIDTVMSIQQHCGSFTCSEVCFFGYCW